MRILHPGLHPPWLIGHRGASHALPENTTAAFDAALGAGCDGLELDVQMSRCGVPVLFHDRTLAKAGLRGRRVRHLDLAELRHLDVGRWLSPRFRGARIPTLDEALRRYAGRTLLLVEVKTRSLDRGTGRNEALAEVVVDLLRRRGLARDVFFLSFHHEALRVASRRAPELQRVLNLKWPGSLRAIRRLDAEAPLAALSVRMSGLTQRFARWCHAQGKPLMTFPCNSEPRLRQALAARAEVIMTDRPEWLVPRMAQPPRQIATARRRVAT